MALKLPRLKAGLAIVDSQGRPTTAFLQLFNVEFAARIEANDAATQANILAIQQVLQAAQGAQTAAQAAQQSANQAQEAADQAGGGTVTSGGAFGTVSPVGLTFVPGPQVDLTGVVAGTLTINGTGPQQDDTNTSPIDFTGEFRVVEIVGMTETTVFLGTYRVYAGSPQTVTNESITAVSGFSSMRSSTGAVSYRIDLNRNDGGPVADLTVSSYIYARRA